MNESELAGASAARFEKHAGRIVTIASLVLALPTLLCRYLPMCDLPQYLAATSILSHLHERAWNFEPYYDSALSHTLSYLPYALARLLAIAMPLDFALRLIVFGALALQPIGVMNMLAARDKPRLFALLSFPFVYSSVWLWGLFACGVSLSLALLACGLVLQTKRSASEELALAALGVATAFSHVYGLLVLLLVSLVWQRRSTKPRAWPRALWPALLLLLPWSWFAANAAANGVSSYPTLSQRVFLFGANLGGFSGPYEATLFSAAIGALALLIGPAIPLSARAFAALRDEERALWKIAALAAIGYGILPTNTAGALFIYPRPLTLLLAIAPLLLPANALRERTRLAISLPLLLALASIVFTSERLFAFDAEARDFDAIVAAARPGASIVALIYDPRGHVSEANPYSNFGAYLQARRGGYLCGDFFKLAWTMPVQARANATPPPSVPGLPWDLVQALVSPELSEYDELLVRGFGLREMKGVGGFRDTLIAHKGAWTLYGGPKAK